MNIAVYCGSSSGNNPKFMETAGACGKWIGENRHTLVYGGASKGLMGAVSNAAIEAGGKVIGVIPEVAMIQARKHTGLTELIETKTMAERKSKMIELLTEPAIKSHTKTEYKLRYIISEVKDVFERSVIFNNMSLSNAYIESKQIAAYAAIIPLLSRDTDDEYFFTQDFKDFVYRKTEDIVKGLVELKESK